MTQSDSIRPAPTGPAAKAWQAGALFVALAVIHTWPLVTDLAHLSRVDNPDTQLNAWTISWIAHQLPRDPLHLFDANIFHPEPRTLAYSEPLLVPGLVGAPLRWLGASPITTYNVLVLIGLATTALAMYALVLRLTGDPAAALLSGCLFAFNAHTLTRLPHLQAFHAQWLPLSIWALDRLLYGGPKRDAVWLALFVSLAAMTSGYLGVFVAVALTTAFLARPDRWWRRDGFVIAERLGLAALVSVVVVVAVLWPHAVVNDGVPIRRPLEEVSRYAATLDQYLTTAGRLHYRLWSHRFFVDGAGALFPGVLAMGLALTALVSRGTGRGRMVMLGATALVGCVLSFGSATPFYEWLSWVFPPAQGIRAAHRFGYLFLFGVAGLAGFGLVAIRKRWVARPWATAATAVACIALVNLEALRAPLSYVPFSGFSPIYSVIAQDSQAEAVVELPFPSRRGVPRNADYVLASTVHWRPLLNGYSGFIPPSYAVSADYLRRFPGPRALRHLRELGVTHVVLHPWRYRPEGTAVRLLRRVSDHPDLQLLHIDAQGSRLYRLH